MEQFSFTQQVMLFYNSDIIISTHGCALINMIFAIPHSVVVECDPPYFYEMSYTTNVMFSRAHYILVSTFYPHDINNSLWDEGEKAYLNGSFYPIHRKYIYLSVNPPKCSVFWAVADAIEYVKRWRYLFEVNDIWSPLFIYNVCFS